MPPGSQSDHNRDGALECDVPVHENTHGVTNPMMTGGGTSACLQTTETSAECNTNSLPFVAFQWAAGFISVSMHTTLQTLVPLGSHDAG
ncbi:hypothetical protein C8J57DRAFT_1526032 [Mycena rebaudengoi]|nr:hypothetical protein C8J57DRAFT_1526032 [Mycena rebaudengoi]